MIRILKQIIRTKSGPINQLLGFTAVFIILMGGFLGAIYLAATFNVLSGIISVATQILAYLIGSVVLYFAIMKLGQIEIFSVTTKPTLEETGDGQSLDHNEAGITTVLQNASKNSLIPFILNFFVGMGFIFLMVKTIPVLIDFQLDVLFYVCTLLVVISILGIGISTVASWLITNNSATSQQMHYYLFKSIKLYFRNTKFLIISFDTILITGLVMTYLDYFLWPNFLSMNFSTLLIIFYKTAANACIVTTSILFLIKAAYVLYTDDLTYEPQGRSPIGFILAGLCLVSIIYVSVPKMTNLVEDEYSQIINQAEQYREDGKLYLCGNAYKKSYALVKAYKGYLIELQVDKDEDATEEQKNSITGEATALFREAYAFYPNAGMIYYLDGLRNLEDNQGAAMNAFKSAKQYDPELYQADLLLLELAQVSNNEAFMRQIASALISNEVYTNESNMNKLSSKKIEAALEKVEEYEQVTLENITTIAYDYYNNQLYSEAMIELQMIKEILPKDIVTNYLIAMTDLELKEDNKAYTTAIEAAETILNEYPNEQWAQELYTGVTLRAGNQTILDEVLKDAYNRNPNDLEVAEQYAYAILKKNYTSSYYEVTEEAEAVVDKILQQDDQRWFAHYCKAIIELYKGDYDASVVHINQFIYMIIEDDSLFSIYDELYNTYVMKYARRMVMDQLAIDVLNNNETINSFTYNYIMGAYGTMSNEIDAMETIEYLNQAIALNPKFSKPYYMIGNAYMEYGYYNNEPAYFADAETYYDRSIQIFEEDPYAWFAMGHVYRKQERFEKALGAFQKTLSYMPAEDHQADHFGVSIHSHYQIAELERMIAEQEGQ